MRRWIGPFSAGVVVALVVGYLAILTIPYGLMEGAVRKLSGGGMNQMTYGNLASPDRQPVVRPSPDLAYSSCPYDLSAGPIEIYVAPVDGRYSSLSVFDAATDVIFVRNDVESNGIPYRILIAREDQAVPEDAEVVRTDYDRGIALIRLLLKNPTEIGALDGARRRSFCRTLGKSKLGVAPPRHAP